METRVRGRGGREVVIGDGLPTVLIGERINPFGKGPVKEAMAAGDMGPVQREALEQVEAGADMLVLSVAAFGTDEARVLPMVAAAVMETVDVPLCLETRNPAALERTLGLGCGKPVVSSVTGEGEVLGQILPLVKRYGTAVVALVSDGSGIPAEPARRVEIVRRILEAAEALAIPREDVLVDCAAESAAVNEKAARVTLGTMELVKREWGLNLVLGASNVSFGLPGRTVVNGVFLALAIGAGLNAAIVNPAAMKPYAAATDLVLGRDARARRYIGYHRKLKGTAR